MVKKTIRVISVRKLVANPANPNKMSGSSFKKLIRNIGQIGIYEPLLIRRCKLNTRYYEIINGYHRCRALLKLGYKNVDCILYNVSDEQINILIATLNRLNGRDDVDRKINLLKSLIKQMESKKLAKILPYTAKQIEKLADLKIVLPSEKAKKTGKAFLHTMVFFVTDKQQKVIEKAISYLIEQVEDKKTNAAKRAAILTVLAEYYLDHIQK